MSTEIQTKQCAVCGENYPHEVLMLNGKECFANVTPTCDKCAEEREQAEIQRRREDRAKAEWERVVPKNYRRTSIDHGGFNLPLYKHVMVWFKAGMGTDAMPWLGLVGVTGRSKTRCLALLVKRLIWNGRQIEWCLSSEFSRTVKNQWNDDDKHQARKDLKRWNNAEILVLDDLGKQKWTDTVEEALFDLLEYRSSHGLIVLWSANTDPEEMVKKLSDDRGAPIIGRLLEFSEIVKV